MYETNFEQAEKKERFRKKFFRDLTSWMGTSIVLVAMDLFLSGSITWSKYPVFFYGIYMIMQVFKFVSVEYFDGDPEEHSKRKKRLKRRAHHQEETFTEDYSDELLRPEKRQSSDLKDYRQPIKPWKDEDLV